MSIAKLDEIDAALESLLRHRNRQHTRDQVFGTDHLDKFPPSGKWRNLRRKYRVGYTKASA